MLNGIWTKSSYPSAVSKYTYGARSVLQLKQSLYLSNDWGADQISLPHDCHYAKLMQLELLRHKMMPSPKR
jgi:hypothetical protein